VSYFFFAAAAPDFEKLKFKDKLSLIAYIVPIYTAVKHPAVVFALMYTARLRAAIVVTCGSDTIANAASAAAVVVTGADANACTARAAVVIAGGYAVAFATIVATVIIACGG